VARLAFLSPLPPAPTGIADYAADVLALLAPSHAIDVFHSQPRVELPPLAPAVGAYPAPEFPARHAENPYELAIYQLGNGPEHDFLYDLMPRVPGLLVLHDLVLHHSRARMLLESEAALAYAREPWSAARREEALAGRRAYSDEVAHAYPAQAGRLAEAHLNTVGRLLPYAYPLFRRPVEWARLTAVHNDYMAAAVGEELPGAPTRRIAMGMARTEVDAGQVAALRARLGIADGELVVGSFGLLTREKQVETVARAVARAAAREPRLRLLLVGPVPDEPALRRLLERTGLARRAVVAGRVPLGELAAHIEAADVAVHLRYPTARETSAALLRVLAQGRPTVISDLEHLDDVPAGAVVRADLADEEGDVTRALLRLASRPEDRARLGARAREFVVREHSPERCRQGYEDAIAAALGT
jgi:glycosyltransferase involved in cell wall biosynthesis